MKKALIVSLALATLAIAAPAQAQKPVYRNGSDYDGYANPGGCSIFVHSGSTELHVGCRQSDKPARIRWRFLKAYQGEFKPAYVDVDYNVHGGTCEKKVRWMVPTPRTLRVVVPVGCYLHIESVTWAQHHEGVA